MTSLLKEIVGRNLRNPEKGIGAYLAELPNGRLTLESTGNGNITAQPPVHSVLALDSGDSSSDKDGNGKVFGIDISQPMLKSATKKLENEIITGKVNLSIGDVMSLPFEDNTFDRVFHTNCFYFWPEPLTCAKELRRVLKPEAFMITGMNVANIKKIKDGGFIKYGNPDLKMYLETLKLAGFSNIIQEDINNVGKSVVHSVIYASSNK